MSAKPKYRHLKLRTPKDAESAIHSDPVVRERARATLEKYTVMNANGCRVWVGRAVANLGYGRFSIGHDSINVRAHRAAWILANGPIPDGIYVCHKCDNPKCTNPEHLFLGTPRDNMLDKKVKGRCIPPPVHRGEAHHNAKLTSETVQEIRASGDSAKILSARFGVSEETIYRVRRGKSWVV